MTSVSACNWAFWMGLSAFDNSNVHNIKFSRRNSIDNKKCIIRIDGARGTTLKTSLTHEGEWSLAELVGIGTSAVRLELLHCSRLSCQKACSETLTKASVAPLFVLFVVSNRSVWVEFPLVHYRNR